MIETRATNWNKCWDGIYCWYWCCNAKSAHNQPSKLKKVTKISQKNSFQDNSRHMGYKMPLSYQLYKHRILLYRYLSLHMSKRTTSVCTRNFKCSHSCRSAGRFTRQTKAGEACHPLVEPALLIRYLGIGIFCPVQHGFAWLRMTSRPSWGPKPGKACVFGSTFQTWESIL